MRKISFLAVLMMLAVILLPQAAAAEEPLRVKGYIGIYSKNTEQRIRTVDGSSYSLGDVSSGEFISFCFSISNVSRSRYEVRNSYVKISGGKELVRWVSYTLNPGDTVPGHVYWVNMKDLGPGTYHLEYYVNDRMIHEQYFTIRRDWHSVARMPSGSEIRGYSPSERSPYICCFPQFSSDQLTEYCVDLRIDHDPIGTYVCGCNWDMDLDVLRKQYSSVYRDANGVAAYAGLQVWDDGSHAVIMSVWNTYCKDRNGNITTIRPKVIYSARSGINQAFDGEGCGTQCLFRYDWQTGKTYRLLIQQSRDEITGNCRLALWICDLETMGWERLIEYDLGMPSNYMRRTLVFLENYIPSAAAQVRSVELSNFRGRDYRTGKWMSATKAQFEQYLGQGSWVVGSDGRSFWAVTTAVPNIWPKLSGVKTYTVQYAESGSPY